MYITATQCCMHAHTHTHTHTHVRMHPSPPHTVQVAMHTHVFVDISHGLVGIEKRPECSYVFAAMA